MEGSIRDGIAWGAFALSGTSRPESGNQDILIHWNIRGEWRADLQAEGVAGGRR
jgi:hypothetical protein